MASSERRELTVTTSRVGTMVDGPGLPEQVRAQLFEPFVMTKPDGMGMGLSVCRTIIEAHGGELFGEDGEDGGAVFRLTVPCQESLSQLGRQPRAVMIDLCQCDVTKCRRLCYRSPCRGRCPAP